MFNTNNEVHLYNTRSSRDLQVSHARTALLQKSPQHMSVKIYKFPREVEDKMRLEPFKRKLKKFLTGLSPYTSEEFFWNCLSLSQNDDHGVMRY